MEVCQTVVVGGGVAGLVAACEAARGGLDTVMLEASGDLGGRARTRGHDGFSFNQGPHALYNNGAFRRALDDFGIPFTGAAPEVAAGKVLWGEKLHPLPVSAAALLTLTPLDLLDRAQFAQTLDQIGKGSFGVPGRTLAAFTGALRPRVGRLVEALVRLSSYANAPGDMDLHAALAQVRLANGGVLYLDEGWEPLTRGLAAVARAAGARLHQNTRVERLEPLDDAWRVHLADGRVIAAASVILATDPDNCAHLASDRPQMVAGALAVKPVRAVCLDLALSSLPAPANSFAIGADEPLYFSVHSKVARLAPDGGAVLHAAWYLTPDEAPAKAHLDRLERFVDQLQPGWREVEVSRQRLMGIIVAHDYPRAGQNRASVKIDGGPPLFLAGDWVGEEGMLSDASAASARAAALAALARLGA